MDSRGYLSRRRAASSVSEPKRQVYIGLDFGTTFAKVAYEVAPTTEHLKRSVRFSADDAEESFYHPTQLYFQRGQNVLRFERAGCDGESLVRFFKYSMVDDETNNKLEKNPELNALKSRLRNNPERLCSAFYLACLLRIVIKNICSQMEISAATDVDWHVNMGMPVGKTSGNVPQVKPVYDEVLQVAWSWMSHSDASQRTVDIFEFDDFYTGHKLGRNGNLHTIPELYAEILMYQQDNNVPEGFYAVVDVGGGTVDMAVFLKRIVEGEGTKVYCVAHEVSAEGMESMVSRIADSDDDFLMKKVRTCLLNADVDFDRIGDFNVSDKCVKTPASRRLVHSIKEFRKSYAKCLMSARDKKIVEMQREVRSGGCLTYFMMGGGGNVHFYNQIIQALIVAQQRHYNSIPEARQSHIGEYLKENVNLECKGNNRLLVSQMLAQPFDNIPQLDGAPWDFVMQKKIVSVKDLHESSNELEDVRLKTCGD